MLIFKRQPHPHYQILINKKILIIKSSNTVLNKVSVLTQLSIIKIDYLSD